MKGRPPGISENQRKVNIILAMKLPYKPLPKPKPIPVAVPKLFYVPSLDKFDRKIDVALFISDNDR